LSLQRLTLQGVRNLSPTTLTPGPGLNWLEGKNGAGKTSVIEAIHLLARGRSFRANAISSVIQHHCEQLLIVADTGAGDRLGVSRDPQGWTGRINGEDCQRVSEFARRLPLILIEPESHRLVSAGPERRRQFMDWLLFHVEPDYLSVWQRYQKLLRQRNAALKNGSATAVIEALEQPMAVAADQINAWRDQEVSGLSARINNLNQALGLRLPGAVALRYRNGTTAGAPVLAQWAEERQRDRELGFTRSGPHRAELVITLADHPASTEASRGQQKLVAVLLVLAELQRLQAAAPAPMVLLDDPVSELDEGHQRTLIEWLIASQLQVWVTATTAPPTSAHRFHVEQGEIQSVV